MRLTFYGGLLLAANSAAMVKARNVLSDQNDLAQAVDNFA